MRLGEVREVTRFLYWLLAENSDSFTTSSSDVAGLAHCLFRVEFDILSVSGIIDQLLEAPCQCISTRHPSSTPKSNQIMP
jgi:hypothetical protein